MELWIRSQDKETLIKTDNIYIEEVLKTTTFVTDKYHIGEWLIECNYSILGCYKTKERALEVLDEIQNILKPQIIISYEHNDSLPIITGEWQNSSVENEVVKELSTYVYEMPKE